MRFKKRIDLNQLKNEYYPNSQISFNLPRGKLDLATLTMYYTGNPAIYRHAIDGVALVKTFNAGSNTVVFTTAATLNPKSSIRIPNHGFSTGDIVKYDSGGDAVIQGLADATNYSIIKIDDDTLRLAEVATPNTNITFPNRGTGANHTLALINPITGNRTIRRFFPRLSSSIISELSVKYNNEVKQHIQEYNMLNAILNDAQKEYDDIDSDLFDTVQEHTINSTSGKIDNTSKIFAVARDQLFTAKYSDANKKKFFINKWLGFLNEGNRYIDTTDKDIQVVIKLAPANILYRGVYVNGGPYTTVVEYNPDYILSDIYCTIDVLDDIPTQPSDFVFNDYRYVEGLYLDSNKKSLTTIETNKPVKWVLGTFSNPNRLVDSDLQLSHCNTDITKFGGIMIDTMDLGSLSAKIPHSLLYSYEVGKFQKDPYLLNSSIYFDRQGRGVRFCKYRLNNYDLTPQLDMIACYNEAKHCFDTDYKKVVSLASFEENFFMCAVKLDDTSEEFKKIDFEVDVDPTKGNVTGGTPMLFYCFTNKL